jgi:cytochrome c553
MHFSQSHGYNPDGSGFSVNLGASGPYHYLLRNEVNTLCLSCHDGNSFAPDVLGANGGSGAGNVRQAGYLNRLGLVGLEPTGHTLDSLAEAPGSSPPWKPEDDNGAGEGLNCINCHHQHGFAGGGGASAYRNLKRDPGNLGGGVYAVVTYAKTTNDLTKDVFERVALDYDEGQVDFNEPNPTQSTMGQWCGGCHTNFHGTPGDAATVGGSPDGTSYSGFLRHPAGGVNIGGLTGGHSSLTAYNGHVNKVKVMSEVGVWDPAGSDVSPTCISCHKGHGNGNAFGLIYRSGTGTLTENGDTNGTQVENLCGQCHGQASAFANP